MGSRVGDRVDDFFERLSILAGTSLHKEGDRGSPKENQNVPSRTSLGIENKLMVTKGESGRGEDKSGVWD